MTAFREGEQALHRFDEWKQVPPLDEVHFQVFESIMTTLFRLVVYGQKKILRLWGPLVCFFFLPHRSVCVDVFIDASLTRNNELRASGACVGGGGGGPNQPEPQTAKGRESSCST
jgi:hypothetical protein